jgi:hypothetical protein
MTNQSIVSELYPIFFGRGFLIYGQHVSTSGNEASYSRYSAISGLHKSKTEGNLLPPAGALTTLRVVISSSFSSYKLPSPNC